MQKHEHLYKLSWNQKCLTVVNSFKGRDCLVFLLAGISLRNLKLLRYFKVKTQRLKQCSIRFHCLAEKISSIFGDIELANRPRSSLTKLVRVMNTSLHVQVAEGVWFSFFFSFGVERPSTLVPEAFFRRKERREKRENLWLRAI